MRKYFLFVFSLTMFDFTIALTSCTQKSLDIPPIKGFVDRIQDICISTTKVFAENFSGDIVWKTLVKVSTLIIIGLEQLASAIITSWMQMEKYFSSTCDVIKVRTASQAWCTTFNYSFVRSVNSNKKTKTSQRIVQNDIYSFVFLFSFFCIYII